MSHVFFFSYAHPNLDNQLRTFFEDLCESVAPATSWSAKDPRISFRDGKDLPLMDAWRDSLLTALQTSSVFVCVTSPAYLDSKFCGQEYQIFDQRRRQDLKGPVPELVLPIIWYPVEKALPFIRDVQLQTDDLSLDYRKKGLRWLKIARPDDYQKCVLAFAEAIQNAMKVAPLPPLRNVQRFDDIPNAFAHGDWREAADSAGWIRGPRVATFVFGAGRAEEFQNSPGKYGKPPADWRPYLPPEPRTVAQLAREAVKKQDLLYRELEIDDKFAVELEGIRDRKNLALVLADPQTLPLASYSAVKVFDEHTWQGTALMVLGDEQAGALAEQVQTLFPIKSKLLSPMYLGAVESVTRLDAVLDITLTQLRASMTQAETKLKEVTDGAPAQISGSGGVGG